MRERNSTTWWENKEIKTLKWGSEALSTKFHLAPTLQGHYKSLSLHFLDSSSVKEVLGWALWIQHSRIRMGAGGQECLLTAISGCIFLSVSVGQKEASDANAPANSWDSLHAHSSKMLSVENFPPLLTFLIVCHLHGDCEKCSQWVFLIHFCDGPMMSEEVKV